MGRITSKTPPSRIVLYRTEVYEPTVVAFRGVWPCPPVLGVRMQSLKRNGIPSSLRTNTYIRLDPRPMNVFAFPFFTNESRCTLQASSRDLTIEDTDVL